MEHDRFSVPMPSNVRPTVSRTTDGTLEVFWELLVLYTTHQDNPNGPFKTLNYRILTSDIMVIP